MDKIEVAVYMPDAEAQKFLLFKQYFEPFSLMVDKNVFGQKNALISLFFDHDAVLQTIQRKDYLFSRKFDVIHSFE